MTENIAHTKKFFACTYYFCPLVIWFKTFKGCKIAKFGKVFELLGMENTLKNILTHINIYMENSNYKIRHIPLLYLRWTLIHTAKLPLFPNHCNYIRKAIWQFDLLDPGAEVRYFGLDFKSNSVRSSPIQVFS